MRTALIAALKRIANGALRAELPLAGRSVLAPPGRRVACTGLRTDFVPVRPGRW